MAAVVTENKKAARQQGAYTQVRPASRPPQHPTPNTRRGGNAITANPTSTITVLPHPRKSPGGLRPLPDTRAPLPMGQRGSHTARAVKNLSVRSPMLAATLSASFAVSLLCFYVTAYARVNAEGQQLSRLRQDLKIAERREIELKGEISRYQLSAPTRAQAMNLIPAPPEMVEVLTDERPVTAGTGTK
ncbi:MAG: hypothetical protein H7145_18370 [Akkermansiaceae bacterium]|nr:hypothetical protein [Armatimonadota bacterium]